MKTRLPLFAALISTIMFGFTLYATKMATAALDYDVTRFLAFRYVVGFAVMLLLVGFKVIKVDFRNKPIFLLIFIGLLNPISCQFVEATATQYVASSMIAIMNSLIPVITTVMSIFINKEYPNKVQVGCMLVSVSGLLAISFSGSSLSGNSLKGFLLVCISVTCLSLYKVMLRKGARTCEPFEMIFFSSGLGALGFTLITLTEHISGNKLAHFFDGMFTVEFLVPALYMAIGSTVIAFSLMAYGISKLPIVIATSIESLSPVIAIFVGIFILGETLRPVDIFGTILIMGGVFIMTYTFARKAMPTAIPD